MFSIPSPWNIHVFFAPFHSVWIEVTAKEGRCQFNLIHGGWDEVGWGQKEGGHNYWTRTDRTRKECRWGSRPPPPAFIICSLGMSFVLEQTCLMVYLEISHLSAIFLAKFSYLRGHFADIRLLYPSSVSAAVSHLCPGTITFAILWIFILVSIGASASQYDSMTVFGDFFKYISRAYIFHYTYLRIFPDTSAPRVHWQEVSKYTVILVKTVWYNVLQCITKS